jgi:hypothetical protein
MRLRSLEGISPGVVDVSISVAHNFKSLAGIECCTSLEKLTILHAGPLGLAGCYLSSLQGLAGLSTLKMLRIKFAGFGGRLRSLDGISPGVVDVFMSVPSLASLDGIECCASMEKLTVSGCHVSSLQLLGGLSSLKEFKVHGCPLTSLEGLNSSSLKSLCLVFCTSLTDLSGVEHISALTSLEIDYCAVTSLQPLSELGEGLQKLKVSSCEQVLGGVLELPHVQPTAEVVVKKCRLYRVVLAGGLEVECVR